MENTTNLDTAQVTKDRIAARRCVVCGCPLYPSEPDVCWDCEAHPVKDTEPCGIDYNPPTA